nr:alpha/beta fold hydrolase [Corynebacterium lactis]
MWEGLGTELRGDGWAVFAPDFGHRATDPLNESIDQLVAYIKAVLASTGGKRAIIVGHSQGGLLATLISLRAAHKIKHVVCLAAPNHGTNLGGIASGLTKIPGTRSLLSNFVQSYWGASGLEQLTGSKMVLDSEEHDVLAPGVTYTCMATKFDQLIKPTQSCFLNDGGKGMVENFYIQDKFPQAVILHEQMAHDWRVRGLTRQALFRLVGVDFDVSSPSE